MGRIKTQLVKRVTLELIRQHKDKFKDAFDENKKIVSGLTNVSSKKLRNNIAGYITRLVKNKEEIE
ncbi:30S ribosomal protein S17e [Candidatus Woesearchaeota archaeon]|nr:30S ribosomal protein S17e [Candidatus Woesearchaeota archaeon]